MKKRFLATMAAVMVSAMMMTACGSNEADTKQDTATEESANSETTVHIGYFILADSLDNNLCINVCEGFSDFDLNSGGFINKGNTLVNF